MMKFQLKAIANETAPPEYWLARQFLAAERAGWRWSYGVRADGYGATGFAEAFRAGYEATRDWLIARRAIERRAA